VRCFNTCLYVVTVFTLQGHPGLCLFNALPDPSFIFIDPFGDIAGGEDLTLLLFQGEELTARRTPAGKEDYKKNTNGTCCQPANQ